MHGWFFQAPYDTQSQGRRKPLDRWSGILSPNRSDATAPGSFQLSVTLSCVAVLDNPADQVAGSSLLCADLGWIITSRATSAIAATENSATDFSASLVLMASLVTVTVQTCGDLSS